MLNCEKFSVAEVASLRNELLTKGLDSWQAAELFHMFLAGRGYGISSSEAISAAGRIEEAGCALEVLRKELEGLKMPGELPSEVTS